MIRPSYEHCIWIKNQGIAFIYIPKTACTSWKIFLWELLGNQIGKEITYKEVHNKKILKLPYVSTMSKKDQDLFELGLKHKSIILTAIIREPRSRVLSGYLDKVLYHNNPESSFTRSIIPKINEYHGLEENKRPNFLQFLQWNKSIASNELMNDHWRPATSLIGLNSIHKANNTRMKIWKMEEMDKAAEWFRQRISREVEFPKIEKLGPRKVYKSEEVIKDYYSDNEERVFKDIYYNDIWLYNYSTTR